MASIVPFSHCNLPDVQKINAVNSYRQNYKWSSKIYSLSSIDNVYFIKSNGNIVGFVEVEYKNLGFDFPREVYIFLHEIHLAPRMQGKSIGFNVMNLLLGKIPLIEFVVVNKNSGMIKLVNKFNILQRNEGKNTTTFRIGKK
ncbi:TPA: GNAT family N-acetyltransferase [Escherichia coli]|nr:GNAT family N-acetyltransferase [Escherichia coli]